ncbi:uncharacterized protein [Zea mays]|uniref:uncharacterized protein isoform X1 n=1 Tax=Zea mays TaxID=4577 RepID=UPI0004DEAAC3|nr:uncharacterized protein LOC100192612 isoform X1 [Zea mays]|eukprot:XP_008679601.1 uncharacterized protein LOC100192612 isoform X1 [Zea mays]
MEGVSSLNQPLINDDRQPVPSSIAKGDQIQGLLSGEWTNERHSSYISSMEASFVEQLRSGSKAIQEGLCQSMRIPRDDARSHDVPESPWVVVRRFRPRGVHHGDGMEVEPLVDGYGSEVTDQNFPEEGIQSSNGACKRQKSTPGNASNGQGT